MEKDYSKFKEITIEKDLPIKFLGSDGIMDYQFNIKTLEELFIAYDNGCFNDQRFYSEVKGQTEWLMAYYINTPLISDEILEAWDARIDLESEDTINRWFKNADFCQRLKRSGISEPELSELHRYCIKKHEKLPKENDGTSYIFWIMQAFVEDEKYQMDIITTKPSFDPKILIIQNLKFKVGLYNSYKEVSPRMYKMVDFKKLNTSADNSIVYSLKEQMEFLLNAKKNLDNQIELLQTQLMNIENVRGMR